MHQITMITGNAPDADYLGETLRLPSRHEHLRPQLEPVLTPLVNPPTEARR